MELIIKISNEMFDTFKKHGIMTFDNLNEYDRDMVANAIENGTPYNPTGDCISREALKNEIQHLRNANPSYSHNCDVVDRQDVLDEIDNAQPVDIKDQIAGAYNEGYMCGNKEAEKARPQGEYVGISKLRLMTVEECAGHTIEYAMGWKACIEWIKKGGAE